MFLCRHLLRRAHLPSHSFRQFGSAAPSIGTRSVTSLHRHVHLSPVRRALSNGTEERGVVEEKSVGEAAAHVQGVAPPPVASPSDADKARRPTASYKLSHKDVRLAAYFGARRAGKRGVAELNPQILLDAIDAAVELKRPLVLQDLADDVILVYKGTEPQHRFDVAIRLLSVCCQPWWRASRRRRIMQRLLQDLEARDELHKIPGEMLGEVSNTCLFYSPHAELDMPILTILTAVLLRRLGGPRTANFGNSSGLPKSQLIWILFQFLTRLLTLNKQAEVLDIFKQLVSEGDIPPSALAGVDLSSGDFNQIILTVLVRCCVQRGWHARGAELLTFTLNRTLTPKIALFDLAQYLIRELLDVHNVNLRLASALIVRVLKAPDSGQSPLPDDLLRLFYSRARYGDAPELALVVYAATQSSSRHYPAPADKDLSRLLRFCMDNKDLHKARMLAKKMVEDGVDVPYIHRPPIIAFFAESGFTKEARVLYERYASRKDSHMVVANPAVLTRIVSLCVARMRIIRNRLRQEDEVEQSQGSLNSDQTLVAPQSKRSHSESSQSDTIYPTKQYPKPVEGVTDHKGLTLEEQYEDMEAFANSVVERFARSFKPIDSASHHQLTALARAHFLLGHIEDGFNALRVVLDRREVPHLADVNVALGALAAYRPAAAARMLERMMYHGLRPDAISFGTVIHHAYVHGHQELVEALMARAQSLNIKLSYKTLATLIRGYATSEQSSDWHLKIVEKASNNILDLGVIPSPKVGADCVHVALIARDARAAMKFWRLLVRDRAEWGDFKQFNLRTRIATLVEEQWKSGELDDNMARVFQYELRIHPFLEQHRRLRFVQKRSQRRAKYRRDIRRRQHEQERKGAKPRARGASSGAAQQPTPQTSSAPTTGSED